MLGVYILERMTCLFILSSFLYDEYYHYNHEEKSL